MFAVPLSPSVSAAVAPYASPRQPRLPARNPGAGCAARGGGSPSLPLTLPLGAGCAEVATSQEEERLRL